MSRMPVYTATQKPSTQLTTPNARASFGAYPSKPLMRFAKAPAVFSQTTMASRANTTRAANTIQAPKVIHEPKFEKLCHIIIPRKGVMSSLKSSSRPTARQTTAATSDANTVERALSPSLKYTTMAAMNAPAPMPPKNRYRAGCQPQISCNPSILSP